MLNESNELEKLNIELAKIGSSIILSEPIAKIDERSNQFLGFDSIDFWMNGVCVQSYTKIQNIADLAELIHCWCELKLTGIEMKSRFAHIAFMDEMILLTSSIEKYLEFNWENLKEYSEDFIPLIELLKTDPKTKNLMAYRQLFDLCLSRYIGGYKGTFINDLPRIRFTNEGNYKVMTPEQALKGGDINRETNDPKFYIGYGNANEAFKLILDVLPDDIKPARIMKKNDLPY